MHHQLPASGKKGLSAALAALMGASISPVIAEVFVGGSVDQLPYGISWEFDLINQSVSVSGVVSEGYLFVLEHTQNLVDIFDAADYIVGDDQLHEDFTVYPSGWGSLSNFFRVVITPIDGDYDGDGIPSAVELVNGTSPIITDIVVDDDMDELPDWWEQYWFDGSLESGAESDVDEDGMSNLAEYTQGSDPTDYYSQGTLVVTPQIQVLSGDGQYSPTSSSLPKRLTVIVTDSATGNPLENAPVVFTPTSGSVSRTVARTISDGRSAVTYRTPDVPGVSVVDVIAGSAEVQFTVTTHDAGIQAPAAPSDFTCVTQPDGSKDLSWTDNSDNEDVFVITLKDLNGQWVELGTVPANQTTATINSDGTLAP